MKLKLLLLAIFLFCTAASAQAQVYPPPGINLGDQFRYVFITSTQRDALSTNIADYNAFVNAAASNNSALSEFNFNVIGSTESVDAIDNTGTASAGVDDVPIFLLDGTQIASGNADLWDGSLAAPINVDENLNTIEQEVWTGSISSGIDDADFELGSTGTPPLTRRGFSGVSNDNWIFEGVTGPGISNHFYAISDVITFVPEPTSATLLVLAGLTLAGTRRRFN